MTLLERLRRMAECLPPGASVTLARDWLVAELDREAVQSGDSGALDDLTVSQACIPLGRQAATVRAMCQRGELRCYRYRGSEYRIPADAITEYLASSRKGAAEARSGEEPPTGGGNLSAWRHVRDRERKSA